MDVIYRLCAAKYAAESTPSVGRNTFLFALALGGKETTVISPEHLDELRDVWRREGQPPVPSGAITLLKNNLLILNNSGGTIVRIDPVDRQPLRP